MSFLFFFFFFLPFRFIATESSEGETLESAECWAGVGGWGRPLYMDQHTVAQSLFLVPRSLVAVSERSASSLSS